MDGNDYGQHDYQAPPMVKFGPKPHQEISADVASMILTDWREHDPAGFGRYLARAMTGENPRVTRTGQ